jgi:ketosteroid isomerase-like protein
VRPIDAGRWSGRTLSWRRPLREGTNKKVPAALQVRAYPADVDSKPTEIAREGLEAWRKGDFETIEEILDRNVEWHATEPGEWDCHGRDDVMQTLRERYEQGFAKGDLQFREGGEHAVIVVAHPSEIGGPDWPSETATVMQFRNQRVVSMQDYRTEAEALAAVAQK